ncbi:MAG: amidohydrolase family protein [Candidatus Binataceae bacterium]
MAASPQQSSTGSDGSLRGLLTGIKVVDSDTHLSEPHDLWTSRAPSQWKDRVPKVKEIDGKRTWVINGNTSLGYATPASVVRKDGSKIRGWGFMKVQMEDVHPGSFNIKERLRYMDECGIWAQIIYPNFLGFGGQRASQLDEDIRLITFQIYNDAMAEIQQESGSRIFPMAMLPWWNIESSVTETIRCQKMGLRGVNMNNHPQSHGLHDLGHRDWDRLWEVCSDLNLPINFHIGASDESASWFTSMPWATQTPDQKLALGSAMLFVNNAGVLANLIFSGVMERFPKLKFASVESGVGWIPFLLEALDYQLEEEVPEAGEILSMTPSEYFRRQIYACFWFERKGLGAALDALGPDNLMFESDFPHPTCLYPEPVGYVSGALAKLNPDVRRKVMSTNAAKVYSLPI